MGTTVRRHGTFPIYSTGQVVVAKKVLPARLWPRALPATMWTCDVQEPVPYNGRATVRAKWAPVAGPVLLVASQSPKLWCQALLTTRQGITSGAPTTGTRVRVTPGAARTCSAPPLGAITVVTTAEAQADDTVGEVGHAEVVAAAAVGGAVVVVVVVVAVAHRAGGTVRTDNGRVQRGRCQR